MSTEGISHCLSLLSLLELRNPRSPSSPFLSGTDEAAYAVYSRPPTKSTYASALVEAGWLACLILCPRGRLPSFLARVSAFASCFPTSPAAAATGDEGWSSLSSHAHYSLSPWFCFLTHAVRLMRLACPLLVCRLASAAPLPLIPSLASTDLPLPLFAVSSRTHTGSQSRWTDRVTQ